MTAGRDHLLNFGRAIVGFRVNVTGDVVGVATWEELDQIDHAGSTFFIAHLGALVAQAAQGLRTGNSAFVLLMLKVIQVAHSGTGVPTIWQWLGTHLQTPTLRALGLEIPSCCHSCKLVWVVLTAQSEG